MDDVREALSSEPAGDPVPGGSWETARRIARNHDWSSPSIVEGIFDRDEPLEHRDRAADPALPPGSVFPWACASCQVYDEQRELDGRPGRVFGWNYRTLARHVESGQMDWHPGMEVSPTARRGSVPHPFVLARPGQGNPLLRIGFRLIGRREQLRFLKLTSSGWLG